MLSEPLASLFGSLASGLALALLGGEGGLVGASIPARFSLCGLLRASGVSKAAGSGFSTLLEEALGASLEAEVSRVASDYSVTSEDEGAWGLI